MDVSTLEWVDVRPKQPEDGAYRVATFRQRSTCQRFAVEKSRNAFTGRTHFTAWHDTTDPDAPKVWLGTFDSAPEARAACERFRKKHLQPRPPLPTAADELGALR